ncbi:MAG: DUF2970 domain-containing protein [Burkholderiales bacterium]|nr:DUF2970 domain-containing protein [Burkholderiales bacterium]
MPVAGQVETPRKAGAVDAVKAVLCAFIGIRRGAAHERDIATLTPAQVIATGIAAAALFVAGLVFLVRYITG